MAHWKMNWYACHGQIKKNGTPDGRKKSLIGGYGEAFTNIELEMIAGQVSVGVGLSHTMG